MRIALADILKKLPQEDAVNYRSQNKLLFKESNRTCIIIDDDPTGNQTVYDIPLLTTWNLNVFVEEFIEQTPVFFVLTNSRSLSPSETSKVYNEIVENIVKASEITKRKFTIISRSDSTLRGHFPLEIDTIREKVKKDDAITAFIPVMFEGGRVTVDDTHYILDSETLIPVNETPFAQDHSFKYAHANLKDYIQEKTASKVNASEVYAFSIEDIRVKHIESLSEEIIKIPPNTYCIFNSLNYQDLDKVTHSLLLAEKRGKNILYRTSSSFVPSYLGLEPRELLEPDELFYKDSKNGGLTIVGSYVKKSSDQLQNALSFFDAQSIIEVEISKLLESKSNVYLDSLVEKIDDQLLQGNDVIVFTSRKLITGRDADTTIKIASTISQSLVYLVKNISIAPRYLIAKGGITSHDLATKGLGMVRSKVLGQLLPGIPTWEMGQETRFPKLPYIVFPGNVGNENSLHTIITKLSKHD